MSACYCQHGSLILFVFYTYTVHIMYACMHARHALGCTHDITVQVHYIPRPLLHYLFWRPGRNDPDDLHVCNPTRLEFLFVFSTFFFFFFFFFIVAVISIFRCYSLTHAKSLYDVKL